MDKIRFAIRNILDDHKAELLAKKLGEGVHPSTLYRWTEAGDTETKHPDIPLRRAIQLTLVTGDTRLISAIAEEAGGYFILGRALVQGQFKDERAALKVLKASSALIEDYTSAISDGKITKREYQEIIKEAMQAHIAIACIVERAREVSGL